MKVASDGGKKLSKGRWGDPIYKILLYLIYKIRDFQTPDHWNSRFLFVPDQWNVRISPRLIVKICNFTEAHQVNLRLPHVIDEIRDFSEPDRFAIYLSLFDEIRVFFVPNHIFNFYLAVEICIFFPAANWLNLNFFPSSKQFLHADQQNLQFSLKIFWFSRARLIYFTIIVQSTKLPIFLNPVGKIHNFCVFSLWNKSTSPVIFHIFIDKNPICKTSNFLVPNPQNPRFFFEKLTKPVVNGRLTKVSRNFSCSLFIPNLRSIKEIALTLHNLIINYVCMCKIKFN